MNEDERYRAEKMESGARFQDHVVERLCRRRGLLIAQFTSRDYQYTKGESLTGVEIKFDDKYAQTGNLWIEVGEKAMPRAGDYAPAGILRGDNTWLYVIGNYQTLFAFAKRNLVLLHESNRFQTRENDRRTSIGFLLPDASARRWAAFIDESDDRPAAIKTAPVTPLPETTSTTIPGHEPGEMVHADEIRW